MIFSLSLSLFVSFSPIAYARDFVISFLFVLERKELLLFEKTMETATHGKPSFATQADALLDKSLNYQKRNKKQNLCMLLCPALAVLGLAWTQRWMLDTLRIAQEKAGGTSVVEIKDPPPWLPSLQLPPAVDRAVRTDFMPFADFPPSTCRKSGNCPVTFLLTGDNRTLVNGVADHMFPTIQSPSDIGRLVLGTEMGLRKDYIFDPAFGPNTSLYYIQSKCGPNSSLSLPIAQVTCLEGLHLWRNSSSDINDELFKGFPGGNKDYVSNEIAAALDFMNTDTQKFNVSLWRKKDVNIVIKGGDDPMDKLSETMHTNIGLPRMSRLINLASNSYLQFLRGPDTQILFEFIKEVPQRINSITEILIFFDYLMPLVYIIIVLYPLPVFLQALVYEKEQNLRIMMKMHGLGDKAYWTISYVYSEAVSYIYTLIFLWAGRFSGLDFFTRNNYRLVNLFFFVFVNWQVSLIFVGTALLSNAKTAQSIGMIFVLLVTFLGSGLFQPLVDDPNFSKGWLIVIELIPGFALYRGILDLQRYGSFGRNGAGSGMHWEDLKDSDNGMREVMIIMAAEWAFMLLLAYYLDQVLPGNGRRRSLLFFLQTSSKKPASFEQQGEQRDSFQVCPREEYEDVAREREKVEELIRERSTSHTVVCDNIKKIYPPRDGNPAKAAVRGMSLALAKAECFGMLGPNGAGKSSFISMMIGLTEPTSGTAYIQGLDITTQMDEIYTCMGVCPQFDLLWGTLTGREHLYFYGKLKNLKGSGLTQAVEESLKAVNLFHGGVADKQAGQYSGGMKRRLSVAISLIGDPKVVYLDEPSTGLDPASRNQLWSVVKRAKQNRTILLTTHSMEEAEALCDRLAIYVDGSLRCIGNSRELKARYGGYFVFTMTTSTEHDTEVEEMVVGLCRDAHKIYHLAGTQKFELPKMQVRLADVFQLVENAKSRFSVQAWALADTTLEDVFTKVARAAQATSSDI